MKKITSFLLTGLLLLLFNFGLLAQQIIGSFPSMDGGFENQTGTLVTASSISSVQSNWTTQIAGTGIISNTGGRSGPKFVTYTQSGTTHRRLQSPTSDIATGSYVVQFYYQGDDDGTGGGDIRGAISANGTANPSYGAYDVDPETGTVWAKYSAIVNPGTSVADIGIGIISVIQTGEFKIDDFVIYAGSAVDVTAPNAPTTPLVGQTSNNGEIIVNWTASVGGVDGGGYLVIRRTSSGSPTAPNTNGIYATGNSIGDGTVAYIGTLTNFTDTGLEPSTTYFYTVYTVDKAFNYSSGVTTEGQNPLPVELSSFSVLPKGNAVQLTWATATEINNFGFEVERSQKPVVSSENSTWQEIGFVKGNGNSNSPKEYSYTDNTLSNSGKYVYRLKQIDNDGTVTYSNEIETDVTVVLEYGLSQNYPNPFNPATVINYTLAEPGFVTIKVYNMLGEEVTTLVNGQMEAGRHTLQFDGHNLSSGMYLYKITAGNFTQVKKMLLTK